MRFVPEVPLSEGLRRTIESFRQDSVRQPADVEMAA
jgi:hypothetical protein